MSKKLTYNSDRDFQPSGIQPPRGRGRGGRGGRNRDRNLPPTFLPYQSQNPNLLHPYQTPFVPDPSLREEWPDPTYENFPEQRLLPEPPGPRAQRYSFNRRRNVPYAEPSPIETNPWSENGREAAPPLAPQTQERIAAYIHNLQTQGPGYGNFGPTVPSPRTSQHPGSPWPPHSSTEDPQSSLGAARPLPDGFRPDFGFGPRGTFGYVQPTATPEEISPRTRRSEATTQEYREAAQRLGLSDAFQRIVDDRDDHVNRQRRYAEPPVAQNERRRLAERFRGPVIVRPDGRPVSVYGLLAMTLRNQQAENRTPAAPEQPPPAEPRFTITDDDFPALVSNSFQSASTGTQPAAPAPVAGPGASARTVPLPPPGTVHGLRLSSVPPPPSPTEDSDCDAGSGWLVGSEWKAVRSKGRMHSMGKGG